MSTLSVNQLELIQANHRQLLDSQIRRGDNLRDLLVSAVSLLNEILSQIHGDTGQYVARYGLDKAMVDAKQKLRNGR